MTDPIQNSPPIPLIIAPDCAGTQSAHRLRELFPDDVPPADPGALTLRLDGDGLSLTSGGQTIRGDFARMLPRLKSGLSKELLVRAARIRDAGAPLAAVDATAGLGEDSLLLAAAGFHVTLYERNPVICELLRDTVNRAAQQPELAAVAARMRVLHGDSKEALLQMEAAPDVILLDPMFPERQKSALVKKKLQMIQKLEFPCSDEWALLEAAIRARPKKLVVKRPPKGPFLAGIKPDYSITGKAVRFDAFASPGERLSRFQQLAGHEPS